MEYLGAAEWYFWLGVKTPQDGPRMTIDNYPELDLTLTGQVANDCITAYKWGLMFGLELTEEEYIDLTEYKESAKVEFIEKKTMQPNMIGNC
jgi:hypothetical protein